ncbi:GFA family protein [uncultured Sulfitobacter sp.]|uniref:GFA family protein n=1 Tax=uncultured Sulfitobacter sp. TaxID=191468 RepID=UPI0026298444|nr:GFA family protein [uncultured Sulfitobacter sp.]
MSEQIQGQCLCGAVQVTAAVDQPRLRACHCDMCRQHTSGAFFSLETVAGSIAVTGPARDYQSSDWASRGFCGACGSTLWYQMDGTRNLSAGLFPDAGGGMLKVEFFADKCPQGYALAGQHKKMTTKETIALFAPQDGDAK